VALLIHYWSTSHLHRFTHTHDHLQMIEIPCTQVGGQLDGRTRATCTEVQRWAKLEQHSHAMYKIRTCFSSQYLHELNRFNFLFF
jgi:hypothetical protein